MDNLTKEQRSKNMRNIRSEDTKPERIIMNELENRELEYTKHDKNLCGKPDIVFYSKKVIVFIDSDFWHGHHKRFKMPKTNKAYWKKKIRKNRKRDKRVTFKLRKDGWNVIRLWEFDITKNLNVCLNKIFLAIGREDLVIYKHNNIPVELIK